MHQASITQYHLEWGHQVDCSKVQTKCKPHAITTSKMVAPHPEQVPSLLQYVTENKSLEQNSDMVIDEPDDAVAGPSTCPDTILDNMAVLLYKDKLELSP